MGIAHVLLGWGVFVDQSIDPRNILGDILVPVIIKVVPSDEMELRVVVLQRAGYSPVDAAHSFQKGAPE